MTRGGPCEEYYLSSIAGTPCYGHRFNMQNEYQSYKNKNDLTLKFSGNTRDDPGTPASFVTRATFEQKNGLQPTF